MTKGLIRLLLLGYFVTLCSSAHFQHARKSIVTHTKPHQSRQTRNAINNVPKQIVIGSKPGMKSFSFKAATSLRSNQQVTSRQQQPPTPNINAREPAQVLPTQGQEQATQGKVQPPHGQVSVPSQNFVSQPPPPKIIQQQPQIRNVNQFSLNRHLGKNMPHNKISISHFRGIIQTQEGTPQLNHNNNIGQLPSNRNQQFENMSQQPTFGDMPQQPPYNIHQQPPADIPQQPSSGILQKQPPFGNMPQQPPSNMAQQSHGNMPLQTHGNMAQQPHGNMLQQHSLSNKPQQIHLGNMPQQPSGNIPQPPGNMPRQSPFSNMAQQPYGNMPQHPPGNMPQKRRLDNMPQQSFLSNMAQQPPGNTPQQSPFSNMAQQQPANIPQQQAPPVTLPKHQLPNHKENQISIYNMQQSQQLGNMLQQPPIGSMLQQPIIENRNIQPETTANIPKSTSNIAQPPSTGSVQQQQPQKNQGPPTPPPNQRPPVPPPNQRTHVPPPNQGPPVPPPNQEPPVPPPNQGYQYHTVVSAYHPNHAHNIKIPATSFRAYPQGNEMSDMHAHANITGHLAAASLSSMVVGPSRIAYEKYIYSSRMHGDRQTDFVFANNTQYTKNINTSIVNNFHINTSFVGQKDNIATADHGSIGLDMNKTNTETPSFTNLETNALIGTFNDSVMSAYESRVRDQLDKLFAKMPIFSFSKHRDRLQPSRATMSESRVQNDIGHYLYEIDRLDFLQSPPLSSNKSIQENVTYHDNSKNNYVVNPLYSENFNNIKSNRQQTSNLLQPQIQNNGSVASWSEATKQQTITNSASISNVDFLTREQQDNSFSVHNRPVNMLSSLPGYAFLSGPTALSVSLSNTNILPFVISKRENTIPYNTSENDFKPNNLTSDFSKHLSVRNFNVRNFTSDNTSKFNYLQSDMVAIPHGSAMQYSQNAHVGKFTSDKTLNIDHLLSDKAIIPLGSDMQHPQNSHVRNFTSDNTSKVDLLQSDRLAITPGSAIQYSPGPADVDSFSEALLTEIINTITSETHLPLPSSLEFPPDSISMTDNKAHDAISTLTDQLMNHALKKNSSPIINLLESKNENVMLMSRESSIPGSQNHLALNTDISNNILPNLSRNTKSVGFIGDWVDNLVASTPSPQQFIPNEAVLTLFSPGLINGFRSKDSR